MAFPKSQKSRKMEFKCFTCRESCSAKDGDWHASQVKGVHQIFLCRTCEKVAKKVVNIKSLSPQY